MKRLINFVTIFLVMVFVSSQICEAGNRLYLGPEDPPSLEILNVKLNNNDLPAGASFRNQVTLRDPKFAGWFKKEVIHVWDDYNPGLLENWDIGNLSVGFHYGFFPSQGEARFGAGPSIEAILGAEADPVTKTNSTSFNGQTFGDVTYSWHSDMEKQYGKFNKDPHGQPYPREFAGVAFVKGRFVAAVHAGMEIANGHIDKNIMEAFSQKIEKKIDIATSLSSFDSVLPSLVQQQGVLRSLQTKLDVFTKNYRKGEYKIALNNINAFVNELDAQRGKHVSEQAYQTLKNYAETIIANVISLM